MESRLLSSVLLIILATVTEARLVGDRDLNVRSVDVLDASDFPSQLPTITSTETQATDAEATGAESMVPSVVPVTMDPPPLPPYPALPDLSESEEQAYYDLPPQDGEERIYGGNSASKKGSKVETPSGKKGGYLEAKKGSKLESRVGKKVGKVHIQESKKVGKVHGEGGKKGGKNMLASKKGKVKGKGGKKGHEESLVGKKTKKFKTGGEKGVETSKKLKGKKEKSLKHYLKV